MTSLFVNADWSALVPAGSPEAAFGITPKDAMRRGLLPLDPDVDLGEPAKVMVSANLLPSAPEVAAVSPEPAPVTEPAAGIEGVGVSDSVLGRPDAKEAPKPADKMVRKPPTK
jgi:hypothetical protein